MPNRINTKGIRIKLSLLLAVAALQATAAAQTVSLGSAGTFAVLGGSTVTNTGASILTGDLGVNPGTSITGFPPETVNGSIYAGGAVAAQAQIDLTAAYNDLTAFSLTEDISGQDLGGRTLTPGVYFFSSSAQLTGDLVLDYQNDPSALFVFQIGSTLTTASNSSVSTINGGNGGNAFWQIGSSATLGTNTDFRGNLIAFTSITMNNGADILSGRALARNGAVTLDSNEIAVPQAVPEPASLAALTLGGLALLRRRRRN